MSRNRLLIGLTLIAVAELFGTWMAGWWRWHDIATCWNPVATVVPSPEAGDLSNSHIRLAVLIRNDGWGRLRLIRAIPTEGRTIVTYNSDDVPTGGSIQISIDQAMLPRDRTTRLVVETNDPANRVLIIDPSH